MSSSLLTIKKYLCCFKTDYRSSVFDVGLICMYSTFKLFLELEPQLRDCLHMFYDSKYATCLKLLDELKVWLIKLFALKIFYAFINHNLFKMVSES